MSSQKKPNIVIVMTDQQRADLRKSSGYALDTMPFLDEWAEGGCDFENAYTPNPTCMPARVSMFTGRYPSCHHVRTNHNARDAFYTKDLLDVMQENGYVTALCGKNHSHRKVDDFDFHKAFGHLGYEGEINSTAEEKAFADFLCATDHMEMHQPSPGGVQVQHPYRSVTDAFEFIDSVPQNKPFFLWLSFAEPHNPFQVPEPYFDMFPPEALPDVTGPEVLSEKGWRFSWLRSVWEKVLGEKDIEQRILRSRSNYHGMLRLIDDQLCRFISGLEDRHLTEDTLVIYLSDHGDFAGEYGLIRKGVDLPDVLTHVPMVFRGAGVKKQGKISGACVSIVDIMPTIARLIGAEIPFGVQGKSILPLLDGSGSYPPHEYDEAYFESGFGGLYWNDKDDLDLVREGACKSDYSTFDCLNTYTQCGCVRSLRKGSWKIQEDMEGSIYLYNLASDPRETVNLADDPLFASVKCDMLASLLQAMMRTCDTLPAPHNRYRVKQHPEGWSGDRDFESSDTGIREK